MMNICKENHVKRTLSILLEEIEEIGNSDVFTINLDIEEIQCLTQVTFLYYNYLVENLDDKKIKSTSKKKIARFIESLGSAYEKLNSAG